MHIIYHKGRNETYQNDSPLLLVEDVRQHIPPFQRIHTKCIKIFDAVSLQCVCTQKLQGR